VDMTSGMGVVERAMVYRATHDERVRKLAEDAGCDAEYVAAVVVRAIFMGATDQKDV
jgi:hypothetical protein